jgi:hypothetical protein
LDDTSGRGRTSEIVSGDVAPAVQDTFDPRDRANDLKEQDVSAMRAHPKARSEILSRGVPARHLSDLLGLVDQFSNEALCSTRVVFGNVVADLEEIRLGQRRKLSPHPGGAPPSAQSR